MKDERGYKEKGQGRGEGKRGGVGRTEIGTREGGKGERAESKRERKRETRDRARAQRLLPLTGSDPFGQKRKDQVKNSTQS